MNRTSKSIMVFILFARLESRTAADREQNRSAIAQSPQPWTPEPILESPLKRTKARLLWYYDSPAETAPKPRPITISEEMEQRRFPGAGDNAHDKTVGGDKSAEGYEELWGWGALVLI